MSEVKKLKAQLKRIESILSSLSDEIDEIYDQLSEMEMYDENIDEDYYDKDE